jgi:hypothetical protein
MLETVQVGSTQLVLNGMGLRERHGEGCMSRAYLPSEVSSDVE